MRFVDAYLQFTPISLTVETKMMLVSLPSRGWQEEGGLFPWQGLLGLGEKDKMSTKPSKVRHIGI